MQPNINLPGLDNLIATCRSHHLKIDLPSPLDAGQPSKGSLLGQPFDPHLAAMFSRCNGGTLHHLEIFPLDTQDGLELFNKSIRERAEERLQEVLRYATFTSLGYYLATVPSMADNNGVQPVMHVDVHEGVEMLPIASSVDKAFDLYARYLKALAARVGHIPADGPTGFHFPDDLPALVAEDWRLVQMLERNQFDFFVARDKRSTDWISQVLQRVQGRA